MQARCIAAELKDISPPVYYEGAGPFVFAREDGDEGFRLYVFEPLSAEQFLADPLALSDVYTQDGFYDLVGQHIDLTPLHYTGAYHPLIRYKVIPDEPACRQVLKDICLGKADANQVIRIMLISPDGTWLSCESLLEMPLWLA